MIFRNVPRRMDCVPQFLVESEDELGEGQALSRVSSRVHGEDEERWKEVGFAILRTRFARRDPSIHRLLDDERGNDPTHPHETQDRANRFDHEVAIALLLDVDE